MQLVVVVSPVVVVDVLVLVVVLVVVIIIPLFGYENVLNRPDFICHFINIIHNLIVFIILHFG